MDGFQIAFLVLAAVVVGALLPLLVQLHFVLHNLRYVLEKTSKDVEEGTKAAHRVAERFDRLTEEFEKSGKMGDMASGLRALSDMALQLRDTLKIASAVGGALSPAVAAAVRAWRADPDPSSESEGQGAASKGSEGSREDSKHHSGREVAQ